MSRSAPPITLGLLMIAISFGMTAALVAADNERPPSRVTVAPVISREVTVRQSFVGTIMPLRTSVVGSAVDGRVLEFLVNEGDAVKAGQPLAKLRTETLAIELAAAKAELKLRREELAELKNGSLPEEVEQAQARLLAAKATHEYRKSNYERAMSLFKQNRTVTDEQLREAQAAAEAAEQSYLEAKSAHALVVKGPRAEKIAQAEAQVEIQAERVNFIEERIRRHTMYAPFDGYITTEHTEVGEWISEGDPVVEVVELREVDVRAGVLSEHAAQLELGTDVPVTVDALPDKSFTGKVALIVPRADELSRSIPVKVRIPNPVHNGVPLLKGGMMAHVRLPTTRTRPALMIPKDSLVLSKDEPPTVFVVGRDAKKPDTDVVRGVPVELGVSDGEWIEVRGPFRPNQQVVVRGNERLVSGNPVVVSSVIEPPGDDE